ncbi:MAG: hypothetical protein K5872_17470 [Rhizobiaceae bacterium]|nr:hypothetical protein [Rhizobiaceae bacterium]MCV0408015.1 hypothetical protein [Rhizobiaceae bacterium]
MKTIAGRECGGCTECCRFIPIRHEVLEKPTNLMCPHCAGGKGCTVYDLRPSMCRTWECGWKLTPTVPADWRPDRSGLVFRFEHLKRKEISVVILDPSPAMFTEAFATIVCGWSENGFKVYFSAVGPTGHIPSLVLVSKRVRKAARARDLQGVFKVFFEILQEITTLHEWEPDGLTLRTEIVERAGQGHGPYHRGREASTNRAGAINRLM